MELSINTHAGPMQNEVELSPLNIWTHIVKVNSARPLSVSVFIQRMACYGIKCAGERECYNVPEY